MASLETDIVIVGGGMVGAALAAMLSAANPGWRLGLVESYPLPASGSPRYHPSYDDRSTAVAQGSVELMQLAGVWEELLHHATPIRQVHVSDRGHLGGALIDSGHLGVEALGYVIPNAWIGRVLISHLHSLTNLTMLAPASVSRIQPLAGAMHLDVETPEQSAGINSRLVVIADGANSKLCGSLGIETRVKDYQQTAIIATVSCAQPHGGVAYERFTDEGPLAMLPLGGGDGRDCALIWTQPTVQAEEVLALSDSAFLQRLQHRFGYRLGHLLKMGKRDCYKLVLSQAAEQVRSSLVVMGNAAHFLHPVAGQGFNLALRDCAALATCLGGAGQQSPGSLPLLQSYQRQQYLDQQATIGFSDQLTQLFSSTRLPLAAIRGLGFIGLECLPAIKGLLARQTMGRASTRFVFSQPDEAT